jgi:predicted phosphoribosyltransferase
MLNQNEESVFRHRDNGGAAGVAERVFRDRREAGRLLAMQLARFAGRKDVVVLGLPRGGVPVAAEVARVLGAPLDVLIVRKLGAPMQEELAIGAVAEGGTRVLNRGLVEGIGLTRGDIDELARREEREVERRVKIYRGGHEALSVADRTVIVIDDGIATGATMRAGLQALRARGAAQIIAVPIGARNDVIVAGTGHGDLHIAGPAAGDPHVISRALDAANAAHVAATAVCAISRTSA